MPPRESKLELSPAEVELLGRWIDEGAEYAAHWSFEAPRDEPAPEPRGAAWARDPLDLSILARLEAEGLVPAPEADRATWLRRVSFDLTGLPPTPEELDDFLADDSARAHEAVVDRLLASPRYGERMATDWLDTARYADTYGYQSDVTREVWPWRDWVVSAFDRNLAWDDFAIWQIAGDLLPGATREQRLATAFQRLHRQTNEGGSVEEEYRVEYVSDRLQTFGTAFLGLTLECARCHDHKFDPIAQSEYYALSAFFDDVDESGLYSHFTSATPTPALALPSAEQEAALAELRAAVSSKELALARAEADAAEALAAWRAGPTRGPSCPGARSTVRRWSRVASGRRSPSRARTTRASPASGRTRAATPSRSPCGHGPRRSRSVRCSCTARAPGPTPPARGTSSCSRTGDCRRR